LKSLKDSKLVMVLESQTGTLPDTGQVRVDGHRWRALPQVQTTVIKGDSAARTGIEGLEIAERRDDGVLSRPDVSVREQDASTPTGFAPSRRR
jgi:hypothetical protein